MSTDLSRRNFLTMTGILGLAPLRMPGIARLVEFDHSTALPSQSVVRGNARFQILSPTLVRMEYDPTGVFVDAPSTAVINRNWAACPYTARDVDGWVEITTAQMLVRYKIDADDFTADTLVVKWTDTDGSHAWKPGDVDKKNLGGIAELSVRRFAPEDLGPLSRNGYFVLDDSGSAIWNAKTQWIEPRPNVQKHKDQYFFVYGRDFARYFREMTQLLGPIPMLPRYLFGSWFGTRAGYHTDEWERVVRRFNEQEIPIDIVVLDSTSSTALVWSGFSFDRVQMPDPPGFFARMKARGVKVTVNEHAYPINRESDTNFDTMRTALQLPESTDSIAHNLADKRYAQLYMDVLHKPALDAGLAFWWQDVQASEQTADMSGLDQMLWLRHVEYEGQERLTGKRSTAFCRIGGWGSHRYGVFFSGDVHPFWSTLTFLVPFNVQCGNSLLPYANNLTGGVACELLDTELYQRWTQFSAFAPLFWCHGMWGLRLPWEYGEEGTETMRTFLTLRYRLIPYLYTYARLAHETGMPFIRGTYLHYPEQEPAYEFRGQYLFGEDFLVAPITVPGGGAPVTKDIYLPAGEYWYDYFLGTVYTGGQVISYSCPLSRMPIFVRAGAIIPMAPAMRSSDEQVTADPLTIDVFAGKASTFRLYEDDTTSLEFRKHAYAWTPITYAPSGADHQITIGPAEGRYTGQPRARRYRIRMHGIMPPTQVRVSGRVIAKKFAEDVGEGWAWQPRTRVLELDLVHPIPIAESVVVTLQGGGVFQDVVALQAARFYRERVRRIKIPINVRWAMLLSRKFLKREPHVLKVADAVERELNDAIDHPMGAAAHPPDLHRMTAQLLTAFVAEPFNSTGEFPEHDGESQAAMDFLAGKTFTPEELSRMRAELLDVQLVATAVITGEDIPTVDRVVTVTVRVVYDTHCIATAPTVEYGLGLPVAGLPGWAESDRTLQADGSMQFSVRPPYPTRPGTYLFTVHATVTWGQSRVILESVLPWVAQ